MTPPLVAVGLHRFFRRGDTEVAALRDVSIRCDQGELLAVTGPSGSGKSTLLALLAGLDDPDGGSVTVAGRRISHLPTAQSSRLRARHIGVLTQSSGLIGHLTVLDNVRLAEGLRQGSGPVGRELLDGLGLSRVRHALPRTLSGGETARAGLAVALAGAPTLLLADEPTAEVTASEERDVLALLARWRPTGGATLLITHSPKVARIADREVRLLDGREVA